MPTINAFTMTPSLTQIIAYGTVLIGIIIFYSCITPNMNNTIINILLSIFYGISTVLLIVFATLASIIDPTDPVIEEYNKSIKQRISFNSNNCYYCGICESYCHQTSKHCRTCKRCVKGFDHHCVWINNCIGENNYRYFMFMIIFVFLNFGIYIGTMIYLSIQRKFTQYLIQMIMSWIYLAIAFILGFLNLNLLILHLYLIAKGLTTFQYIQIKKQQQRRKTIQVNNKQFQKQTSNQQLNKQGGTELKQQCKQNKIHPINISIKNISKQQSKNTNKQMNELLPQIKITDTVSVGQSEGNVSIIYRYSQPYSQKQKPIVNLSKFITGNKSMNFIASSSVADVEEPKRNVKINVSQNNE